MSAKRPGYVGFDSILQLTCFRLGGQEQAKNLLTIASIS